MVMQGELLQATMAMAQEAAVLAVLVQGLLVIVSVGMVVRV